ncbi:thiopeptide-type bacteriocin biosynthesis protein [Streptomyces sp. LBL]|uniref:lantibiotic dehydratase n=1 Tax=Streptomyces sp. LBL TaxID=2940562 RepID=UPI002472F704|nr:lantibiotic dehydratase [Streptomyces sp. LBL]MDH6630055.1 thiopeptide-type bacteriocin biosynthesis protein [Streptomyces sp. LBL]
MAWLRAVWANSDVAEALQHSSPVLATQVRTLCTAEKPSARDVRRATLSVARYLLRSQHRATPFGLFAGVTTAEFGPQACTDWGVDHVAVGHAGAEWLATVVERLESCPDLLQQLPVVLNGTVTSRGDRLIVPFQSDIQDDRTRAVEASLTLTEPVRTVLAASQTPIRVGALEDKLRAEFPAAEPEKARRLLGELIRQRVLITSLHAPSTETDALGYLLDQLDAIDVGTLAPVAETMRELRAIRAGLEECVTRGGRDSVAARMRAVVPGLRRHPVALDLRLDARIVLPDEVAREIERAVLILTRVSARPYGTAAWGEYHQRFYERYGIGTMVPLQELVADSGAGYPDGYPGTATGARRPRVSARDDALVRLAQAAALDGRDEMILTDELITALDVGPDEPRVPSHLELGVRVLAASLEELQRGRFRLEVVSVSRGAGVSTGRFLSVLTPGDREALAAELVDIPAADSNTVPAQLSFPPLLSESAHVTRAPQVLPTVISLQEHRAPADAVLTPRDLAVGCDGRRLYLAAPERGQRIEAVGMHALNLKTHTPPLVRFLTELSRAQCAQVTVFDWGAAAAMPFLPRLRYRRTVLAPARWRLEAPELPDRAFPQDEWDAALTDWRARRRLPQRVYLVEDDRRLFLDLDQAGHRTLLRHHLDRARLAVLVEAAEPEAFGWCDGRAHEVVVPLKANRPPAWPPLPVPTPARALSLAQMQTPAVSSVLLATLYGDARRQDTLLSRHLPDLLERLGGPRWWFIRFRDPEQHLRLRIALPAPEAFAATAHTVSAWANELRVAGLLADLRYPTSYREMGRWGSGTAWDAAEEVFRADSRAILAQFFQPGRPHQRTLVAVHTLAIASAFLGSTQAGMRWLIEHVPPAAPAPVPRPQFTDAVRLADPNADWAKLRDAPGGAAIVSAWADRDAALAAYRPHLPGLDTQGIALDDVLTSLLHVHFVRHIAVNFPEEEVCLYLARAAALAWTARTTGRTP